MTSHVTHVDNTERTVITIRAGSRHPGDEVVGMESSTIGTVYPEAGGSLQIEVQMILPRKDMELEQDTKTTKPEVHGNVQNAPTITKLRRTNVRCVTSLHVREISGYILHGQAQIRNILHDMEDRRVVPRATVDNREVLHGQGQNRNILHDLEDRRVVPHATMGSREVLHGQGRRRYVPEDHRMMTG